MQEKCRKNAGKIQENGQVQRRSMKFLILSEIIEILSLGGYAFFVQDNNKFEINLYYAIFAD